jgi:aspartyl-tRNA(Asn)/glutamyl-tRNA(Gln) amidotransferase subunit A
MQPAVSKNYQASLKVLGEIAALEDVRLPDLPYGDVIGTIIEAEAAASFRELLESGRSRDLRAANDKWGGYAGCSVLAVDYLQAMRVRTTIKRQLDELYANLDAVVAPARNTVAYPLDVDFQKAYPGVGGGTPIIPAGNLAGQPAIAVPNGLGDNNLPTGVQFTGRAWSEARLLTLAKRYQEATDFHTRRPKA